MEAQENSQKSSMFEGMVIVPQSQKHKFEIRLQPNQAVLAQRNPFVFCRKCGKFGRKDYLKARYRKDHPYDTAASIGFVCHGEEPNRDKYEQCSQEQKLIQIERGRRDQLECQKFFWINGQQSESKNHLKDTNKAPVQEHDNLFEDNDQLDQEVIQIDSKSLKDKAQIRLIPINASVHSKTKRETVCQSKSQKCGKTSRDMRKNLGSCKTKLIKKQEKSLVSKKAKKMKIKIKTMNMKSNRKTKICTRELKKLKVPLLIKQSSKGILKQKKGKSKVIESKRKTKKQISGTTGSVGSLKRDHTRFRWQRIILRQRMQIAQRKTIDLSNFYKSKIKELVAVQNKELYKTWDDNKKQMLKEREGHVKLYNQSANFDSLEQKLKNSEKVIVDQKDEIILALRRMGKYAKHEVKDYPKNLIENGEYDPIIWKITREAASDEDLINTLKAQLKEKSTELDKLELQNQQLKGQILSASTSIQMMTDACKLAIQNQRMYQPQCFEGNNEQIYEQDRQEFQQEQIDSSQIQKANSISVNVEQNFDQLSEVTMNITKTQKKSMKTVRFSETDQVVDTVYLNTNRQVCTKFKLLKQKLFRLKLKKQYNLKKHYENKKKVKTLKVMPSKRAINKDDTAGKDQNQNDERGLVSITNLPATPQLNEKPQVLTNQDTDK